MCGPATVPVLGLGILCAAFGLVPALLSGQDRPSPRPTADGPRGPLGTTEQNPLYRLFYVPVPGSADPLPAARTSWAMTWDYSSIFERALTRSHEQLFDHERLSTTLAVQYSLAPRWEVGGRWTVHTAWSGFLDPVIQGLHDVLGVSNGDRAEFPNNEYANVLRRRVPADTLYHAPAAVLAPQDPQLFGRFQIHGAADNPTSAAVRATVTLPVGRQGYGARSAGFAAELLLRHSWTQWHVHGLLGGTSLAPPAKLDPWVKSRAAFASVTVERTFASGWSGLIQATGGNAYLAGIGEDELDDFPLIVAFGVAGGVPRVAGWTWQAAFVEDIPPNGPSADVTVHLQLTRIRE